MYLDLNHLLWLMLLAIAIIYWWKAYGVKQLALTATKSHCSEMNVQLLDESLALKRIRIRRDESGTLKLLRCFNFEFASTGDDRYCGETIMHGQRCITIKLDPHRI